MVFSLPFNSPHSKARVIIFAQVTSSSNSRSSFRPDIEGLRGLAVLLVVLFHSRVPGFNGGFVGVDIFFALSGYLITGLIVAEVEQTGTFSFRNFYARRVRRLLPASGLAVVGILLFGFVIYSPLEMASYAKWAIYTSLYISNYMFMRDAANYFAADVETNPFLHTWSLAIEEQFYLFWPALIVLSLSWLKSRRRLAVVLCVICIASFIFCVWLTRVRQPWAFFSLPSRVWEFSLGGMACLLGKPQLAQRSSMLKWLAWGRISRRSCRWFVIFAADEISWIHGSPPRCRNHRNSHPGCIRNSVFVGEIAKHSRFTVSRQALLFLVPMALACAAFCCRMLS